jgi:hypothetical protein
VITEPQQCNGMSIPKVQCPTVHQRVGSIVKYGLLAASA